MEEINSKLIFDKISKDLMNSSVNIIYQGENEVDSNSKNNIVEQYKLLVDSSHKIALGGAGGSRTRVQTRTNRAFYMFILQLVFDRRLITDNPPGGLVQ